MRGCEDAREANGAEDRSEDKTSRDFAPDDTKPIVETNLAERHGADDERRCLEAGVATTTDDERDEKGEHHSTSISFSKYPMAVAVSISPRKSAEKPSRPLLDHAREADLEIGGSEALGLPHLEHSADALRPAGCLSHGGSLKPGQERTSMNDRASLLRWALRLEFLTVAWNVIEGIIAVADALVAGSVALLGFGIDSFVESASGGVLIWRLQAERSGTYLPERIESLDERAHRLVALTLFCLLPTSRSTQ